MTTYAVELKNLSKTFGREPPAVDGLNLQIHVGEFFSLLGPSGCGKTTTLRMIAGFETPSTGEIYIHGRVVTQKPAFHRPVNTVFQNYALFPHLSVFENVAFGLEMDGLARTEIHRRVGEILDLVKLRGMEKRYPRQLSGGQQQRVALARALVKQPQVLLFDEPLGALDLKLRKEMQLELKRMQQSLGITFVYVTHDQEEALTMSDRIAVMRAGHILQVGTPREIYEQPGDRFVADFIGETNFLMGRVTKASGEVLIDEQLPLQIQGNFSQGQIVTLVIRPEKAIIYTTRQNYTLPGAIEEVIYLGTDTRYVVRLTPRTSLVVRSQNLDHQEPHRLGEVVWVQLSPQSIFLLPEDQIAQADYGRIVASS